MARDRVPVLKRCRSLGLDPIYLGIEKKSKKENPRAGKKISEYGLQLREKQKAKFIYGVLEKQFRGYFARAEKMREGIPGENLISYLNSDLTTLCSDLDTEEQERKQDRLYATSMCLLTENL